MSEIGRLGLGRPRNNHLHFPWTIQSPWLKIIGHLFLCLRVCTLGQPLEPYSQREQVVILLLSFDLNGGINLAN